SCPACAGWTSSGQLAHRVRVEREDDLTTLPLVERSIGRLAQPSKPAPFRDPLRSRVVRRGREAKVRDAQLVDGPGGDEANRARREAAPSGGREQPVADV